MPAWRASTDGLSKESKFMAWAFDKILQSARSREASDVHLVRGVPPVLRIHGEIYISKGSPLDEAALSDLVNSILSPRQRELFNERLQLCFSRYWEGVGRVRASIYLHAGCPELSIRLCETVVRSAAELGLPPVVESLTRLPNGLILVTGPTGVGKTTTLNFMVDLINRNRRAKIVTIEDPVEFVHENIRSIVIQQEVGTDVRSFREALVHVLRQDPDVIVVGEMRDLESIQTALIAAETGHLVMATLHTPDTVQTIQRIHSVFPADQQNAIIVQLSATLQAAISQKLLPRADRNSRVLASEVLIATPAVRNHIREGKEFNLYSEMQTGRRVEMQTMDSALLALYQKGEITYDVAISNAHEASFIQHQTGNKLD
jgi:twitching motility protein PilT